MDPVMFEGTTDGKSKPRTIKDPLQVDIFATAPADTSREAFELVQATGAAAEGRRKILRYLAQRNASSPTGWTNATADEFTARWEWEPNFTTPRLWELERAGLVAKLNGKASLSTLDGRAISRKVRRNTRRGSPAYAYTITDHGLGVVTRMGEPANG